jgi:hypothetical protein
VSHDRSATRALSQLKVPQSESHLPRSFMPLPITITMENRIEFSDYSELYAYPEAGERGSGHLNHRN